MATKRLNCMSCGYRPVVLAQAVRYGACPACEADALECTASLGCPECRRGAEDIWERFDAEQLERATYHGMTEAEFLERSGWYDNEHREPFTPSLLEDEAFGRALVHEREAMQCFNASQVPSWWDQVCSWFGGLTHR